MAGRTRIKVCGITDNSEALLLAAMGIDALGFIFADKSPRKVHPDEARAIIRSLPPFVDAVGVFVNEGLDTLNSIIHYCNITLVQLHGDESPEYCQLIPARVIKAFRISPASSADEFAPYRGKVSGFLLDTFKPDMPGGTGKTFDWRMVRHLNPPGPIILGGGMAPENVEDAVREVRPFAVDANSGVEISPGRKDMEKIRRLIDAVRNADRGKE